MEPGIAAKHSTMHRQPPTTENYPVQSVRNVEVEGESKVGEAGKKSLMAGMEQNELQWGRRRAGARRAVQDSLCRGQRRLWSPTWPSAEAPLGPSCAAQAEWSEAGDRGRRGCQRLRGETEAIHTD